MTVNGKPTLPLIFRRMSAEKVIKTGSNKIENATDGVEVSVGLQPIANATDPLSPQLMFKRKRSEDSVPSSERSVVLKQFHSHPTDPSSFDQSMFGLRLAERSLDSNDTHNYSLEATASQPASSPKKSSSLKLLNLSTSDVRSAERSIEFNVLHSYHSDPSASQSASFAEFSANLKLLDSSMSDVRSSERSIELNILDSYHSDPSALCFAENSRNSKLLDPSISDVRSAERSIDLNILHSYHSDPSAYQLQSSGSAANHTNSELSDSRNSIQLTSFDHSTSDVRSAERSIELDQLHSFHLDQSPSQLHSAGLVEASIDSNVLNPDYSAAQIGSNHASISDVRSAERSLEL